MAGAELPTGRASEESADGPLFPADKLGATSCVGCWAAALVEILEVPPVTATVAGAAGAGLASGFNASGLLFSGFASGGAGLGFGCVVFATGGGGAAVAVEVAAGVPVVVAGVTGAGAGVTAAVTGAFGCAVELPLRNSNHEPTAITATTTAMPTTRNLLLPGCFCSPAIASKVPKLALATGSSAGSTRFSSLLGKGTGAGGSTAGALMISIFGAAAATRTGAMATAAPEPFEPLDLIITGAGGGVAGAGGRGAVTTGSMGTPSSRARRSFNNNAEIWSAMVFNTATCVMVNAWGVAAKTARTPTTLLSSLTGVTTMERIPRARMATVSTRVSVSASSQRSSFPDWMQSPVKLPSTRKVTPTSGALDPLRARQTISSTLPSLSAMAAPEAFVKACARWAMTASSSEALVRSLYLEESVACVAIVRRP